jgi:hypothetical protein
MYNSAHTPSIRSLSLLPLLPGNAVRLVVGLAVAVAVVLVGHEEVLVGAVSGERDRGGAKTGEGALETVPARERTLVSPRLSSLPGVVSGLAGGLPEGADVEASDVGLGPVGRS